jgi:hypothetical protein
MPEPLPSSADGQVNLDLLAYDIANMLDRFEYPIDVSEDDIRLHLPEFIAKIQATAQARGDEPAAQPAGGDAATWSAAAVEPPSAAPVFEQPKYGRVRVWPQYLFDVWEDTEALITVTDWDKQGEGWARQEAARLAAEHGQTIKTLWKKDQLRWLPYAGTPRGARPC